MYKKWSIEKGEGGTSISGKEKSTYRAQKDRMQLRIRSRDYARSAGGSPAVWSVTQLTPREGRFPKEASMPITLLLVWHMCPGHWPQLVASAWVLSSFSPSLIRFFRCHIIDKVCACGTPSQYPFIFKAAQESKKGTSDWKEVCLAVGFIISVVTCYTGISWQVMDLKEHILQMHPWIILLAGSDNEISQFLSAPALSLQMFPATYVREGRQMY